MALSVQPARELGLQRDDGHRARRSDDRRQAAQVAMHAPKNGFLYVIDRTNGQLISAEKIAKVTWAERIDLKTGRPVEIPAARFPNGQDAEVWPTTTGAHSWMPMAYSPQTRLLYIPKVEQAMTYNDR